MSHLNLFIIVFAFSLSLFSCKKESDYWGEIYTLKNGIEWQGNIKANNNRFSNSKIDITIETLRNDGFWENLLFFKVPLKEGKYKLSRTLNQSPDDNLVGGEFYNGYDDELHGIYEINDTDSTSYIEITYYDEKKQEIKGNFNLILWADDLGGTWSVIDSIVFANGVFHTRIND
ncbi:MAG: hypothetical protein IPJ82_04315 [Lewinellaceae bacterium]|nr:hypothetical protein [Lewinellaceae bacterium]